MASIIKKKVKGHIYYYYAETRRVNGKPRIVNQKYLGSAECILKKLSTGSIVGTYNINTTNLIYDATNFFTYIDTKQDSELAKRGRCKSKRNDLKIVGLSMMVSPDHSIPLLYETYPGNRNDAAQFTIMLNSLKSRYKQITNEQADITVIFDRGNNSADNIKILESNDFPMHYVGGLKRNQCEGLLDVPDSEYTELNGIKGARSFRRKMEVFDREMTVVTVFNQHLYDGQMQGVRLNIEKTLKQLSELQARLYARHTGEIKKGKKPTVASIDKQVNKILSTEFMKEIFTYSICAENPGATPLLSFSLDKIAFLHLQSTVLGKTVHFTNRHEWTNEEIVTAYRSAWKIEHAFRQMKDTDHMTVRPLYHWTDQKINVHIFYCVLSYRLCCLLKKELDESGIQNSMNCVLDNMKLYKYVVTVMGNNKSDIITSFTHPTELTSKILDKYKLKEKYLSCF